MRLIIILLLLHLTATVGNTEDFFLIRAGEFTRHNKAYELTGKMFLYKSSPLMNPESGLLTFSKAEQDFRVNVLNTTVSIGKSDAQSPSKQFFSGGVYFLSPLALHNKKGHSNAVPVVAGLASSPVTCQNSTSGASPTEFLFILVADFKDEKSQAEVKHLNMPALVLSEEDFRKVMGFIWDNSIEKGCTKRDKVFPKVLFFVDSSDNGMLSEIQKTLFQQFVGGDKKIGIDPRAFSSGPSLDSVKSHWNGQNIKEDDPNPPSDLRIH